MISLVGIVRRLQAGHILTPQVVEPRPQPWEAPTVEPSPHLVLHPRHVPVIPRRNEEPRED